MILTVSIPDARVPDLATKLVAESRATNGKTNEATLQAWLDAFVASETAAAQKVALDAALQAEMAKATPDSATVGSLYKQRLAL